VFEFQSLLKQNDSRSKLDFHKSLEFPWGHTRHTCLEPLFSSLPITFGPCDSFLQNGLCFLIEIEVRPTQTLESLIACWQHLNIACPTNGVVNPNTSHDTIKVNAVAMVKRLNPSSLTYAITKH